MTRGRPGREKSANPCRPHPGDAMKESEDCGIAAQTGRPDDDDDDESNRPGVDRERDRIVILGYN